MTYSELVAAVAAWTNDAQIEPSIPTFITLAEAAINRRLAEAGAPGAVVRARCTIDSEYSEIPDDFARPLGLTHDDGRAIVNVSAASFDALRQADPAARGAPERFTVAGTSLRFYPAPDRAYAVELCYQAKLAPLSPAGAANWVSTHHPDVYLYGALLQSAPFLGEDGRLGAWSGLYTAAVEGMMAAQEASLGSRATPGFRPNMPARAGTCP
jgi:hypothetical protein